MHVPLNHEATSLTCTKSASPRSVCRRAERDRAISKEWGVAHTTVARDGFRRRYRANEPPRFAHARLRAGPQCDDKDHVRLVKKPWSGMSASIQRIAALAAALRSSSPSYQSFKQRADSALFRSSTTQNPMLEISAKLSPRARKYVMSKRSGTGGHAASARLPRSGRSRKRVGVSRSARGFMAATRIPKL